MTMPIAAKYLSGVSTESVYSCTFPGSPVRINVPLELISRLRTELERNERLANSPGTRSAECCSGARRHKRLLRLTTTFGFPQISQAANTIWMRLNSSAWAPSTFVVGYFRTQPGDEMRLRAEEITFFGKHFTDATNVALLVHTSRRPYTAGFFFGMKSVLSPIFPLDAELLRSQAEPRRTEAGVTRTGPEVEMTLPLLASSGKDAAEDMDARQPHRFPDLERTWGAASGRILYGRGCRHVSQFLRASTVN